MVEKINSEAVAQIRVKMESSIRLGKAKYFFNNFHFKFGHSRDMVEAAGAMDKFNKDIGVGGQSRHSSIFLNQTPRAFFSQLDNVAESLGFSSEEARQIADEKGEGFYKEFAPKVFMKLIEIGYSKEDLII